MLARRLFARALLRPFACSPLRCVFPCWHSARAFHETDLDLYIYDENGNLIDSDAGNSFLQAFGFQFVEAVKITKHLDAI